MNFTNITTDKATWQPKPTKNGLETALFILMVILIKTVFWLIFKENISRAYRNSPIFRKRKLNEISTPVELSNLN
jgi:hypothetical protein